MTIQELFKLLEDGAAEVEIDCAEFKTALTMDQISEIKVNVKLSSLKHITLTDTVNAPGQVMNRAILCNAILEAASESTTVRQITLKGISITAAELDMALETAAESTTLDVLELADLALPDENISYGVKDKLCRSQSSCAIRLTRCTWTEKAGLFAQTSLQQPLELREIVSLGDSQHPLPNNTLAALPTKQSLVIEKCSFVDSLTLALPYSLTRLALRGNIIHEGRLGEMLGVVNRPHLLKELVISGRAFADGTVLSPFFEWIFSLRVIDLRGCTFAANVIPKLLEAAKPTRSLTVHLNYSETIRDQLNAYFQLLSSSKFLQIELNDPQKQCPASLATALNRVNLFNSINSKFSEIAQLLTMATRESLEYKAEMLALLTQAADDISRIPQGADPTLLKNLESEWMWRALQWQLITTLTPTVQATNELIVNAKPIFRSISRTSTSYEGACSTMRTALETLLNSPVMQSSAIALTRSQIAEVADTYKPSAASKGNHDDDDDDYDSVRYQLEKQPLSTVLQGLKLPTTDEVLYNNIQNAAYHHIRTDRFLLKSVMSELRGERTLACVLLQQSMHCFPDVRELILQTRPEFVDNTWKSPQQRIDDFFIELRQTVSQQTSALPESSQVDAHRKKAWDTHADQWGPQFAKNYKGFAQHNDLRANISAIFENLITPGGWTSFMRAAYGRIDTDVAEALLKRLNEPQADVYQTLHEALEILYQRHKRLADSSCARRLIYCLYLAKQDAHKNELEAAAGSEPRSAEVEI